MEDYTQRGPHTTVHASTVAISGHAVAIIGPSGSGKSGLALQLIALGALLISDDQTYIEARDSGLWVSRPRTLPELIEVRGVGLLPVPMSGPAKLKLVVDLETLEPDRFPKPRSIPILGQMITVLRKVAEPHFPAAIFVYLSKMPDSSETTI